jgi:hypothetical protein
MFILYFFLLVAALVGLATVVDRMQGKPVKRPLLKLMGFVSLNYKAFGLVLMVAVWYGTPYLLDLFTKAGEQQAATMDGGVFQTLPLATIRGLVIYLFTRLFLKREVSVVYNYFTSLFFTKDFSTLTPWQKHLLTAFYLLGFCLLFSSLTR